MTASITGTYRAIPGYKRFYNLSLSFLLGVVVFFLTRQFPFGRFSFLMDLSLFAVFGIALIRISQVLSASKPVIRVLCFCMLSLIGLYALFSIGVYLHPFVLVFRFAVILFLISLAYFIQPPAKYLPVFQVIVTLEALFVLLLEAGMLILFNQGNYLAVRFYFLNHGWGDVYTYNGWFYFIQVRGTAILPFAYMFNYLCPGRKYFRFRRIILLLGVIFSGNFGYLIGIAFFHFFWFFKSRSIGIFRTRVFKAIFLAAIVALPALSFVSSTLQRKGTESLGTRYDQISVLFHDLCTNVGTLFMGRGLGNQVQIKTQFRDYSHYVYYELQSLYFLNQMGVLFFLLFIGYNILLSLYNYGQNKWILLVYGGYIIYASTNPYFLDTTQIVVILTLNALVDFKLRGT